LASKSSLNTAAYFVNTTLFSKHYFVYSRVENVTILRVGTSKKYSDNWSKAFGAGKGKAKAMVAKASAKAKPGKSATAKKAGKK
jgi:hypothetical protein